MVNAKINTKRADMLEKMILEETDSGSFTFSDALTQYEVWTRNTGGISRLGVPAKLRPQYVQMAISIFKAF